MSGSSDPPPPLLTSLGSATYSIGDDELEAQLASFLHAVGDRDDILLLPPDFTRFHSQAGKITRMLCELLRIIPKQEPTDPGTSSITGQDPPPPTVQIMPALGTHAPMTPEEITKMYGDELGRTSPSPFRVHKWREDVVTIGTAPAEMVRRATRDMVDQPFPVQLNQMVWDKRITPPGKRRPLVISIGQIVPHEVLGMSNYNKNLLVGVGGVEAINLSHFIGAVHGMENMMGKADNPLRDILNYASQTYLEGELDLWYILTVVSHDNDGELVLRGLFIGRDIQCYSRACELSLQVNFTLLEKPIQRCVVYLDPDEFHSTWLGNKAIYRTRMAMADGGELFVLAPGVERFGEDNKVDELIRKYGYKGTPTIMKLMDENSELRENLSVVAHLIHGSTEGRFTVTYSPGRLTREEVEASGFQYAPLDDMLSKFRPSCLRDGWHRDDNGEEFFFIGNPALGLWAIESRFQE